MDTECPKQRKVCQFWQIIWCWWCFPFQLPSQNSKVQSNLEGVQHHLCALSWPECCRKRIQHQQGIIGWKFARKIVSVTKNGIWPHQLRKINIHEYELPSDLLKSCKLSNPRYNAALEETKKREKIGTVARKRKLIDEDI